MTPEAPLSWTFGPLRTAVCHPLTMRTRGTLKRILIVNVQTFVNDAVEKPHIQFVQNIQRKEGKRVITIVIVTAVLVFPFRFAISF